jgi:hypothetical protein
MEAADALLQGRQLVRAGAVTRIRVTMSSLRTW